MNNCPKCQKEVEESCIFCPVCGTCFLDINDLSIKINIEISYENLFDFITYHFELIDRSELEDNLPFLKEYLEDAGFIPELKVRVQNRLHKEIDYFLMSLGKKDLKLLVKEGKFPSYMSRSD